MHHMEHQKKARAKETAQKRSQKRLLTGIKWELSLWDKQFLRNFCIDPR